MKKRCIWQILLSLSLIIVMAGCQFEQPGGQEDKSEPAEARPTPVEESVSSSPLSSPIESPSLQNSPLEQPTPLATPTFPRPAANKAAIRGALIVNATQSPLPETQFYLVSAIGEQADQLPPILAGPQEGDLWGYTDKQGWFALTDIPPGAYYLAIWAPLNWVVLSEDDGANANTPLLLKLEPEQTLDLGTRIINWP